MSNTEVALVPVIYCLITLLGHFGLVTPGFFFGLIVVTVIVLFLRRLN